MANFVEKLLSWQVAIHIHVHQEYMDFLSRIMYVNSNLPTQQLNTSKAHCQIKEELEGCRWLASY
jgi:hypothetical protein